MHDNRPVVLAVGGYLEATAEFLDYTQQNATWQESKHFLFVLLDEIALSTTIDFLFQLKASRNQKISTGVQELSALSLVKVLLSNTKSTCMN